MCVRVHIRIKKTPRGRDKKTCLEKRDIPVALILESARPFRSTNALTVNGRISIFFRPISRCFFPILMQCVRCGETVFVACPADILENGQPQRRAVYRAFACPISVYISFLLKVQFVSLYHYPAQLSKLLRAVVVASGMHSKRSREMQLKWIVTGRRLKREMAALIRVDVFPKKAISFYSRNSFAAK